ncbi:MAG: hypothetical protein EOM12_02935 [Verrucomicrobiae bacterium]|nr:hypothetical protein [Verrucomicrobiae bacterium]
MLDAYAPQTVLMCAFVSTHHPAKAAPLYAGFYQLDTMPDIPWPASAGWRFDGLMVGGVMGWRLVGWWPLVGGVMG